MPGATSSRACRLGLRKSASSSSTRLPVSASVTARFAEVVLLPSPARAEVIRTTWGGWSRSRSVPSPSAGQSSLVSGWLGISIRADRRPR